MHYQLKTRQICLFFLAFLPVSKLFILPSILATHAKEDMWISSLLNLTLDFITLLFIISACKKAKTNFYGLLENNFGKVFAKIIMALYLIYFLLKAIVPLNEQKDYVELTLYTLKPSKLYFLPFFAVAFYLCLKPLRVVGRASDVLWLFTVMGTILLFALSIPNADFEAILPIGANGIKNITSGSFEALNWFGDAIYLAFFIGEFDCKKKDGIKIMISFIISAFIVVCFMVIFYAVFTSIAYRQRFALTEVSKYTAVINNIGRFDYVGIVLILFSNVFALALPLYFSCRILNYICNFSKTWIAPTIIIALESLILIVFTQSYLSIENFIMTYASAYFLLLGNILPIFTAILKPKEKNNEIYA